MANERALGISIIYAAQTWRQLAALFGDTEARAIFGLTNVLALFGGSKDIGFNKEVSDLVGTTRVARTSWQLGSRGGRTASGEDMPILRPEEVRQLPERQALVIAENTPPILAKLRRCIDGKPGRALLDQQRTVRDQLSERRRREPGDGARAVAALAAARKHSLLDERGE
jgi:type IV secretion system protein VirD4